MPQRGKKTPILKWVKKDKEEEVKQAFEKTLNQRKKGGEEKNHAEMDFFETLVCIHREGEGASFTGLKPAGEVEPSIAMADKAIEDGSIDKLVNSINQEVSSGIAKRFEEVVKKRKHKDESVEAGREFVEAYVEFIHYVERLYQNAMESAHHNETGKTETETHHVH